nr:hypothetical protein [uncultured Campylobacter sp.]
MRWIETTSSLGWGLRDLTTRANAKFMHYASRDEACCADDMRYKFRVSQRRTDKI